jgi:hypothetical protein
MRGLRAFLRQSFVMEFARGFGIAAEIELIFPAKFKTRFAQGVVAKLRAGMAFLLRSLRSFLASASAVEGKQNPWPSRWR